MNEDKNTAGTPESRRLPARGAGRRPQGKVSLRVAAGQSIAQAVEEAANGGFPVRIEIEPGEYHEHTIELSGRLELTTACAPGSAKVILSSGAHISTAGDVAISGLAISSDAGVLLRCVEGILRLNNCVIRSFGGEFRMLSSPGTDIVMSCCTIYGGYDGAMTLDEAKAEIRALFPDLKLDCPAPPEPVPGPSAADQLAQMIGLRGVKERLQIVQDVSRRDALRRAADLPVLTRTRHLIFAGPPGVGKTTVARLLARTLADRGELATGAVVEVSRADLIGKCEGHSLANLREAWHEADGGVLFIDECQVLLRPNDDQDPFGGEIVAELTKLVEDRRDEVMVILAGTADGMQAFLDANPALKSRFPRTITFPPYSTAELLEIVRSLARQQDYVFSEKAAEGLEEFFRASEILHYGDEEPAFPGNGRDARAIWEIIDENHARSLRDIRSPTVHQLRTILPEHLPGGSESAPHRGGPS